MDEFAGPIETWPTYKAISVEDWSMFKTHQVVYTDGTIADGHEAGWLVCLLCDKKAATRDMMYAHIESMKHKRNMEWFNPDLPRESSPQSRFQLTAKDKQVLDDNRCVVEDEWIVCTLCNKKLMDMSFVPDHISTKKHRNNIDWANAVDGKFSPTGASSLPAGISVRDCDYYCSLCDASMTSRSVVDVHIESLRHTRNLDSDGIAAIVHDVPIRRGVPISQLSSSSSRAPVVETARPRTPREASSVSFEDRWSRQPITPTERSGPESGWRSRPVTPTACRVPSPPRRVPSPPWTVSLPASDLPNLIDI